MQKLHRVMGTPNSYIQAPGLLAKAGEHILPYGSKVAIITGQKSWHSVEERLVKSLEAAAIEYAIFHFQGECSNEEVERLATLVSKDALIVGVGGGKVLDTAKALSNAIGSSFIAIPTLASNCAAVSALSVMYTADGVYINYPIFNQNTLLCLVDSDVLAAAPILYLVAGIGDTLAKWFESQAASQGKPHNVPTLAGLQMAKLCYEILFEYSDQAIADAKLGIASDSFQKVTDTILLISGMVGGIGNENCRTAAAHSIHNGLTVLPETHHYQHGDKVAYGIIVQMVLENRPQAEIKDLIAFYQRVGLPYTLKQLGIEQALSNERMAEVARVSLLPESTMHVMPFPITQAMIIKAMTEVERY